MHNWLICRQVAGGVQALTTLSLLTSLFLLLRLHFSSLQNFLALVVAINLPFPADASYCIGFSNSFSGAWSFTSLFNLHQALSPKTQTPQGPGPELPHKPLVSTTLPESHSFRNHSQIPGQNAWDAKASTAKSANRPSHLYKTSLWNCSSYTGEVNSSQFLLPHEYFQAISCFYKKSNMQRVFWELFVKIGNLGFFGFRAFNFFILILHGHLQK